MRTVLIPCARDANGVVVVDADRKRHHVVMKADPEFAALGDGRWGVVADLIDRDGPRVRVRLPGGAEVWVRAADAA